MKIEKYVVGMIGTNCYLVINEETKDTVMVDPGAYPAKLKNAVKEQGLKLKAVLLTHAPYYGAFRCDGRYKNSSICGRSRSTDDDGR